MARKKDDCRPKTLLELYHYISRMSDAFNKINILLKIVCTMLVTTFRAGLLPRQGRQLPRGPNLKGASVIG